MISANLLTNGFTRQETLKLTDCSSSRLSFLERTDLITPVRVGSNERPAVLFSWEQLIAIRLIKELRQDLNPKKSKIIVKAIVQSDFDSTLANKQLVAIDDWTFWVNLDWSDFGQAIEKVVGKRGIQEITRFDLTVVPQLMNIVQEIWSAANTSEELSVVDFNHFKARAKIRP